MWSRRSNIALIGLAGALWLLLAPGPARGSIEVGYDLEQGTYVRTSDRRWEFNPYAMVQLLNVTSVPQAAPASTSVAVHAAKLIFHGHVFSPKLTYHFQVNFGEGRAVAENMYLYYQPLRWLGLLVGQIEVPLNRQHITLEAYQQFVERSQVDRRFTLQRSVGLAVYLNTVKRTVEWTSGVWRSPAAEPAAATLVPMLSTRLALSPTGPIEYREGDLTSSPRPRLQVALAGAYDPHAVTSTASGTSPEVSELLQGVAEFTLRFRGISVTGEGHLRHRGGAASRLSYGAFAQAGVLIGPPFVELVARYGWLGGDMASGDIEREMTAGGSYYFHGHRFKIQGNYSRLMTRGRAAQHRVLLQLEFFV